MMIDMVADRRQKRMVLGRRRGRGVRFDGVCLEAGRRRLSELDWRKTPTFVAVRQLCLYIM